MNEKFLSRGKREDNGKWVEGYYVELPEDQHGNKLHIIIDSDGQYNRIIPETAGRYTTLNDRNEIPIFDGDIIELDHPYMGKSKHKVIWEWDEHMWNLSDFYATCFDYPSEAFSEGTQYMTVIGNVYDNPELLTDKEKKRNA